MYEFIHRISSNIGGTTDPDSESHQHYEVHCGKCQWWGYKKSILEFGCPMCSSTEWLEYENNSPTSLHEAVLELSEKKELFFQALMQLGRNMERRSG